MHRRFVLFFVAVMCVMATGSLAQAAPNAGAIAARAIAGAAQLSPGESGRAYRQPTLLKLILPALPAARLQAPPAPRDELRPVQELTGAKKSAVAERDARAEVRSDPGLAIHWRESREIVSPNIVSLVRNYRRDGLPIVHLYQSEQNLLAIGLNNHGIPGIYFTRHVGG